MDDETTVTSSYMFRGVEYIVTMVVQGGSTLSVEVEDRLTADQWRATFDSAYVEDLTHKTGNFKQFHIFVSMLESAVTQSSESVSLDLLTYADLESLRQRKTGSAPKQSIHTGKTASLNSKRYLIVTYTVEFDRIHYPLPLPYMGKPDPRALQEVIRQQRNEIKALRQQGGGDHKHSNREFEKLQKDYSLLLKEKEELEAEFLHFRREVKTTSAGAAVKELRMLKVLTKNLEEDLMKEKSRHQRSTSKRSQEYRDLLEEVEELRASERNLRIRVKNLTNELAVYRRDKVRNPLPRSSRPPARDRYNSRERSVSRERQSSRERSLSRESLLRDRSWSSDGGLSARDSSLNRERRSSRERNTSARERSRLSNRSSNSFRNSLPIPRSRTPSPAGARVPRFDPTAYIKDQERKKKEQQLKKQRGTKSNLSGSANRFKPSPKSRGVSNYSRLSGGSKNRSRTSSFGSQGEFSDGGYSDSSYSRLHSYNKNPVPSHRTRSANAYTSSPEMPQKSSRRCKSESKDPLSSTPDSILRTKRRRNVQNKENFVESAGEDSDYYNGSAEISEIDERLSKLQALMKNSLD